MDFWALNREFLFVQFMGQQQMMGMGTPEEYHRQLQQTPNGGWVSKP